MAWKKQIQYRNYLVVRTLSKYNCVVLIEFVAQKWGFAHIYTRSHRGTITSNYDPQDYTMYDSRVASFLENVKDSVE